jgi:hypothetical protein
MRFLVATVCLLLPTLSFAENYPVKAPEDVKVAVTNVLREQLASQLSRLGELRANGAHDDRKEIKLPFGRKIVQITQFRGWVSLRFNNPERALNLSIRELSLASPNEIRFAVSASCPAAGHAHAGIEKGPSIGSDFSATINLGVTSTISWSGQGNALAFSCNITKVEPSLSSLKFKNGIVDKFAGVAQKAANGWANDNRNQLRDKANEAIRQTLKNHDVTVNLNQFVTSH